mmetsp:Transcript_24336/g.36093  ORF Transcript_24336/g.36093 Transcript_24336/m.36093 type:complete len:423 (-) Transcript_24336:102-1370(-)|eukprot:CAMPEP_0194244904 /NCGR_PEP_ID=MMETSP0158-20130606/12252_1 /TAXON_ID=33649 /ORGANISM="Thalassionema nitzschioides, Strain L26-B" /LENGTH=422 /DNA_ID=CAMNT_0038980507 /DNA_START=105 /DNA_END=1373 /DNA_ORIENTATION=+
MKIIYNILFSLTLVVVRAASSIVNELGQEIYDHDASWAIRSKEVKWNNTQSLYKSFMDECREAAGPKKAKYVCDEGEDFRIEMNTYQPMSMRNYTRLGFKKIKAPEEMFSIIKDFWDKNRHLNESEWHSVNTYHNMWSAPPTIVNIQEEEHGGGRDMANKVWEAARQTLEDWTGMHLSPCSIWGIRLYHNNSILTTHVDRNPLVTSAIINVDQDVDEPWPLEVWGHDGVPYNITMEPGEMVLYESHSVLHGRPFPMNGRFFANLFVHFEPLGAFRRENHDEFTNDIVYHEDSLISTEEDLPPYVIPDSPWDEQWREQNPDGWYLLNNDMGLSARKGDLRTMDNLYIQDPESIHEVDDNGWGPLHEATRGGQLDVVKYLHEREVDLNLKTGHGRGNTALRLAKQYHGEDSDVYKFLEGVGAES